MNEYQLLNLMYQGFTFNAMYSVGFILFTWLGFRMARNIYEDSNAAICLAKYLHLFLFICSLFLFSVKS